MKIELKKRTFEPISVTIETKEELLLLFGALNVSSHTIQEVFPPEDSGFNPIEHQREKTRMWEQIRDAAVQSGVCFK